MNQPESKKPMNQVVKLGPLVLKNPVTVASGTFGYGLEFIPHMDLNRLGAIFVKGLTRQPRWGHPQVRLAETPAGLLNCIGLQNIGIETFIEQKLPALRNYDTAIIANINGSSIDEYAEVAEILSSQDGIAALEVNVSCPNVREGGISFGTDPFMTEQVTRSVREKTHLPLIVKLTPNVTDIKAIARAACNGGADIISLINTLLGMAIDPISRQPILSNITGGLSGPAIKPVALRCVYEVYTATRYPIIGMGGIYSGTDAVEFLVAGASAVSIGTANFSSPDQSVRILDEMIGFCMEHNINDFNQLTGSLITG